MFPVFMNFLSPYVIVSGAFEGIVTGSAIAFCAMFAGAFVFGRLWCSWICPGGCIGDILSKTRTRRWGGGFKDGFKYVIWSLWICGIIALFIAAGGIKGVDPLYLTENGISVDTPVKYVTYYAVVSVFMILSLLLGKRAMCHSVCWMAPFLVLGRRLAVTARLPAFRLFSDRSLCESCGTCTKNCPMSLPVQAMVDSGKMERSECILCAQCADGCPRKAIRFGFGRLESGSKQ